MATVCVIQTGQTVWDEQVRVESAPGAPLTPAGRRDVEGAARELAAQGGITTIYASDGQAEQQTAELIAQVLGAKVRTRDDLRELDYGLWQGLTQEEIRRRQPRLFRQWIESPASVRPPGGESLDEARQRLRKALKDILRRHKDGGALLVLRPVMLALLKCMVHRGAIESLWRNAEPTCKWELLEADKNVLSGS